MIVWEGPKSQQYHVGAGFEARPYKVVESTDCAVVGFADHMRFKCVVVLGHAPHARLHKNNTICIH